MSLVNDMLRDLDGRLSSRDGDGALDGLRPALTPRTRNRTSRIASTVVAVTLLGAGIWAWRALELSVPGPLPGSGLPPAAMDPAGSLPVPPAADTPTPPELPDPAAPAAASPTAPAAAVVEDVRARHDGGQTRLVLDLDRPVRYTVTHDAQRLVLALEDARLGVPLPGALLDGSLVRETHSSQEGSTLSIELGLTRAVRVQTSLLQPLGSTLPRLVLSLRDGKAEPPPPAAARPDPPPTARSPAQAVPRRLPVVKRPHRPSPAEAADAAYAEAVDAAGRGQVESAITGLETALGHQAGHRAARESLAMLLAGAGREAEARSVLREGLERAPGHVPYLRLQARLMAGAGELATAVDLLEQALPRAGDDAGILALLAALYQRQGRHAESVLRYSQALELRPGQGPWWAGLAIGLEARGDGARARRAYAAALARGTTLAPDLRAYAARRLEALGGG